MRQHRIRTYTHHTAHADVFTKLNECYWYRTLFPMDFYLSLFLAKRFIDFRELTKKKSWYARVSYKNVFDVEASMWTHARPNQIKKKQQTQKQQEQQLAKLHFQHALSKQHVCLAQSILRSLYILLIIFSILTFNEKETQALTAKNAIKLYLLLRTPFVRKHTSRWNVSWSSENRAQVPQLSREKYKVCVCVWPMNTRAKPNGQNRRNEWKKNQSKAKQKIGAIQKDELSSKSHCLCFT